MAKANGNGSDRTTRDCCFRRVKVFRFRQTGSQVKHEIINCQSDLIQCKYTMRSSFDTESLPLSLSLSFSREPSLKDRTRFKRMYVLTKSAFSRRRAIVFESSRSLGSLGRSGRSRLLLTRRIWNRGRRTNYHPLFVPRMGRSTLHTARISGVPPTWGRAGWQTPSKKEFPDLSGPRRIFHFDSRVF